VTIKISVLVANNYRRILSTSDAAKVDPVLMALLVEYVRKQVSKNNTCQRLLVMCHHHVITVVALIYALSVSKVLFVVCKTLCNTTGMYTHLNTMTILLCVIVVVFTVGASFRSCQL